MNADKLLKTLPVLQAQLDALLEFDCTSNDLSNGKKNCVGAHIFFILLQQQRTLVAC